eukprot:263024_1
MRSRSSGGRCGIKRKSVAIDDVAIMQPARKRKIIERKAVVASRRRSSSAQTHTDAETEELARKRRNRISAQAIRDRKSNELRRLEQRVAALSVENETFRSTLNALENGDPQISALRTEHARLLLQVETLQSANERLRVESATASDGDVIMQSDGEVATVPLEDGQIVPDSTTVLETAPGAHPVENAVISRQVPEQSGLAIGTLPCGPYTETAVLNSSLQMGGPHWLLVVFLPTLVRTLAGFCFRFQLLNVLIKLEKARRMSYFPRHHHPATQFRSPNLRRISSHSTAHWKTCSPRSIRHRSRMRGLKSPFPRRPSACPGSPAFPRSRQTVCLHDLSVREARAAMYLAHWLVWNMWLRIRRRSRQKNIVTR